MRKSVQIKNSIAKVTMLIGMLMILGAGSSVDLSNEFKQLALKALIGVGLLITGFIAREW